MVEGHFGGPMVAGIKANFEMEFRVDTEFCTGMEDINNMKVHGIMECLMEREHNFSKMGKNMKERLKRTNFMDKVYFIKMTRLFMEFGRTMNCQLLTWSNQA